MRILGTDIKVKFYKAKFRELCRIDQTAQKRILSSHSQYLEDVIIQSIFPDNYSGFYVDIGANDPDELSNTKKFYDKGWSGINIEPNIQLYKKLCSSRQHDINLNLGIADICGYLKFYELDPDTLSTFSEKSAKDNVKTYNARIVSVSDIEVSTLERVLTDHCGSRTIDFMSVDSEGLEKQILFGNNWDLFRPVSLVIELNQDSDGLVIEYLNGKGYQLIYYNETNGIFVDSRATVIRERLQ